MRLTVFLIIISLTRLSATAYGQKVTLNEKNVPLETVLKKIKQQSGYNLFYNAIDLKKAHNISIDVKNVPVEEALRQCAEDQPLSITVIDNTIVVKEKEGFAGTKSKDPVAAEIEIKGKITDEKGETLSGVTVNVKGANISTSTDADGNYSIRLPDKTGVLVFSFVGYETQEIPFAGQKIVNIILK